jgi:hypothetical protein
MATTNQSVDVFPIAEARSGVRAKATFSAEGDVTNWQLLNGDVAYQGYGPVSAATVGLQRSTVDPSGGAGNPVEVDDATGSGGGGLAATVPGVGNAWYRLINKTTFGPANTITERSLASLAAAINGLQPGANGFAPDTDPQPLVHAVADDLVLTLTAATPGVAGNSIATTAVLAGGDFADATLINGADAVTASGLLTFTTEPAALDTVTVNGRVYTFVAALTGAADEVLRGATVTTARDNLIAALNAGGAGATGTLTASGNPAAGDTVQIGGRTYTFVAALSSPAVPGEVVRDAATDTVSLDHLVAAINSAAGGGTTYSVNTPPNADVSAVRSGSTIVATARVKGTPGIVKTVETSANLSWGATALVATTGPGATYGLGTVINPDITAAASGANMTATAKVAGVAGNAITTTAVSTHIAWGAGALAAGADAVAATGALTMTDVPDDGGTVTVGAITYTFKDDLTPTAGEVMIAGTTIDVTLTGERAANA